MRSQLLGRDDAVLGGGKGRNMAIGVVHPRSVRPGCNTARRFAALAANRAAGAQIDASGGGWS